MKVTLRCYKLALRVIRNGLLCLWYISKTIQIGGDVRRSRVGRNRIRRHESPLETVHCAIVQGIVCRNEVGHNRGFKGSHAARVGQGFRVIEKYNVDVKRRHGCLRYERGARGRRFAFQNCGLGGRQHSGISTPAVVGHRQDPDAVAYDVNLEAIRGRDIKHGVDFVFRRHRDEKCAGEFIATIPNRTAVLLAH